MSACIAKQQNKWEKKIKIRILDQFHNETSYLQTVHLQERK